MDGFGHFTNHYPGSRNPDGMLLRERALQGRRTQAIFSSFSFYRTFSRFGKAVIKFLTKTEICFAYCCKSCATVFFQTTSDLKRRLSPNFNNTQTRIQAWIPNIIFRRQPWKIVWANVVPADKRLAANFRFVINYGAFGKMPFEIAKIWVIFAAVWPSRKTNFRRCLAFLSH